MNGLPLLSLLTFLPLAGGLLVLLLSRARPTLARPLTLATSFATLAGAILLWSQFQPTGGLQFQERHDWVPSLGIQYFIALDGLGLVMVLLSAFLVPFALLASGPVEKNVPLFCALVLFLETGLMGAFSALNFFHWFLFWELSLIPAFFLVKLWGGPGATRAAYQFFVYTFVGSVAMLLSFLAIYAATGTFDFLHLAEMGRSGELTSALFAKLESGFLSSKTFLGLLVFFGVFLGLAVKVPLLPFHTWLPATYAEAPTGVSMLLTGAMSKMGVYGFLRILLPLFPEQMLWLRPVLLALAVATIVFSAFAACAQKDLKRIAAYSSINHLGYCLLGIFSVPVVLGTGDSFVGPEAVAALDGVILQMCNHGLTAAALFCFIGFIEQRSGGKRGLDDFGGLRAVAPVFCGLMGIALFSSLGLPGLNGFIGEFLIFKGAFALAPMASAVAASGLLIAAVFLLGILQRVWSGPLRSEWSAWPDLTARERLIVLPALVLMFVLGVYPQAVLGLINPTVMKWVEVMK